MRTLTLNTARLLVRKSLFSHAVMLAMITAGLASADTAFTVGAGTGSPACGTLSSPGAEGFCWNYEGGSTWGSPGVGDSVTPYSEAMTAFGMDITFTGGGTIDAASVATGNASNCGGGSGGGTTFCTEGPQDIWQATIVGPDTIDFIAQDPTFYLTAGQDYFVNIFFDGDTPTGANGEWLTEFSGAPEPGTLAMFGIGLAGLGLLRRRITR